MIDYEYAELFKRDSVDKQLSIAFDGGTITNTELHSEQFELTESICSDSELKFGSCEASSIKFKISNVFTALKDKWLTVSDVLNGNTAEPFLFGKYKVASDIPTADRRYRNVTAYDAMYDILIAEVSAWYNALLPDSDSKVTLKQFRYSFLNYFDIEQEEVTLPNDDMIVERTIEPSELSGKTVITAICEINGCFGHIGRNGKFQYIFLKEMVEGVYPRTDLYPRKDLYPADPMNAEKISGSHYISAEYEDFTTAKITKLQIRQEENDIGCIYGDGNNCYIVQDNFLVYGKSSEELQTIAANLYEVIHKVWYRPATVEAKGNPCLEVGDGIRLKTKYEIIYTYILQRTLKGIQSLRDTYTAEGEQYQSEDVNSVHESIIQLKGKTNVLTRTIEETKSEIKDVEKGLSTEIQQNAESILLEAKRAVGAEEELSASIKVNADSITAEVKRASDSEEKLSASIKVNAENITAEVKRASDAEGDLSSQISVNAQNILLKVSKDSIISEINQTAEKITISAQKIDLKGLVEAEEFTSKYATITKLDADEAELNNLITDNVKSLSGEIDTLKTDKLSASEFTAENISAMSITVSAANVTGNFSASRIDSGTLSTDRLNVSEIIRKIEVAGLTVAGSFGLLGKFAFNNRSVKWEKMTVGGTSYRFLVEDE
jgi:hypothetical protein